MKDLFDGPPPQAEQLLLDLPRVAMGGRDDVVVGESNRVAVEHLDSWPNWPRPLTVLAGPSGSGKTHLARCWAAQVGAVTLDARALDAIELGEDVGDEPFLIEDADRGGLSERSLFHILNAARAHGLAGLVTARFKPGVWNVSLPDLNSRLKAATQLELAVPDDAVVAGVAMKLFAERQVAIEPETLAHLVSRSDRSLKHVQALVRRLDYLSLARRRPVTRALVSEALRMEAQAIG